MGKDTISSQELADYTHVNSTQIRRDLSGFGKFGKRGVGYNVDSLVSQIRKILRTSGQHNIARSEEHTSELQSRQYLVCRLLLEKKKHNHINIDIVYLEPAPLEDTIWLV